MRRPGAESGHTLLIVVVMVMVMIVSSTVAVKVWSTVVQRDNEEELIYRGKQYAQALFLYRKAMGTLPTDLKQLDQLGNKGQHFIRKLFKDPITGDDFGLVYFGPNGTPIPDTQLDGSQPAPGLGGGNTGLSGFTSNFSNTSGSGLQQNPGGLQPTGNSQGLGAQAGSNRNASAFGTPTTGGLPIMGVHSKSSLKVFGSARWRDLEHYNEWLFLITDLGWGAQPGAGMKPATAVTPGVAVPGAAINPAGANPRGTGPTVHP